MVDVKIIVIDYGLILILFCSRDHFMHVKCKHDLPVPPPEDPVSTATKETFSEVEIKPFASGNSHTFLHR